MDQRHWLGSGAHLPCSRHEEVSVFIPAHAGYARTARQTKRVRDPGLHGPSALAQGTTDLGCLMLRLVDVLQDPTLLTREREPLRRCCECQRGLDHTTGWQPTPDGLACDDCYYEKLG